MVSVRIQVKNSIVLLYSIITIKMNNKKHMYWTNFLSALNFQDHLYEELIK